MTVLLDFTTGEAIVHGLPMAVGLAVEQFGLADLVTAQTRQIDSERGLRLEGEPCVLASGAVVLTPVARPLLAAVVQLPASFGEALEPWQALAAGYKQVHGVLPHVAAVEKGALTLVAEIEAHPRAAAIKARLLLGERKEILRAYGIYRLTLPAKAKKKAA